VHGSGGDGRRRRVAARRRPPGRSARPRPRSPARAPVLGRGDLLRHRDRALRVLDRRHEPDRVDLAEAALRARGPHAPTRDLSRLAPRARPLHAVSLHALGRRAHGLRLEAGPRDRDRGGARRVERRGGLGARLDRAAGARPHDGARRVSMPGAHPIRFAATLVGMNLRQSFALRGAFWLQALFMMGNNLIFFVTWWIFFQRFDDVGGWRLPDVAMLFGVVAAGYGVAAVFAGGVRELARTIADGD